jgi:hypothetical protein
MFQILFQTRSMRNDFVACWLGIAEPNSEDRTATEELSAK